MSEKESELEIIEWRVHDVNSEKQETREGHEELSLDQTLGLSPGALQHEEVGEVRRNQRKRSSPSGL